MKKNFLKLIFLFVFSLLFNSNLWAFDSQLEGKVKAGSQYIFETPLHHDNFDNEIELRLGVLGNFLEVDEWVFDYELSADAKFADGPSIQSGLRSSTDINFFRAWLRVDNGSWKIRGGRQKILFGAGSIYRPLGFFDTRNVTGVVPETRGIDSLRSTWFLSPSSFLEGWVVPAKKDDSFIVGLRGEALLGGLEAGLVAQYHPKSDLKDLADFGQEMVQLGYHLKGEKEIGFWNESRLDIELQSSSPVRFDTVLGADYTLNLGEGLHMLVEYFLTTQQKNFTLSDPKGHRTIQQIGFSMDQPVGIDIKWQVFGLYDLRDKSFQLVPQVEYSITSSLFLYVHGRVGGNIAKGEKDGRLHKRTDSFSGTESLVGITLVNYF